MIVLGINDGFDSGAAIIKDGVIVAAINEERLSRIKFHEGHYYGWPAQSLSKVFEISNIKPEEVDIVAIAGIIDPPLPVRLAGFYNVNKKERKILNIKPGASFTKRIAYNYFAARRSNSLIGKSSKMIVKRLYKKFLEIFNVKDKEIIFIDHHLAHAASAYYTSGKKKVLVVTMDGHGDGLSSSIRVFDGHAQDMIAFSPSKHSVGWFYSQITHVLGFKMHRHEGKITGLAAFGDSNIAYDKLKDLIKSDGLKTVNNLGSKYDGIKKLPRIIDGFKRADVAAAAQRRFEEVITDIISKAVDKTGIGDVALAGGVFANVKLNQSILELANVDSVFIHPHMGDGGTTVGAALAAWASKVENPRTHKLSDVYFCDEISNEQIEEELARNNLKFEFFDDVENVVAEKLADKKIVGVFHGRMEYGPRALGNRSILADPTDKTINDWLNKRLRRTEFMPFAPSILDRAAPKYYINYEKGAYPARFMTITFDCTEAAKVAPAVIHIDNTARPQVVSKEQNSFYYRILERYERLTGLPIFVNTSFNMHEEPIVHSPYDAVRAFNQGSVDVLAIGNFIVERQGLFELKCL